MFVVTVALISRLVSASRPAAAIRSPVSSGAGFVWGGVVHMQSPPLLKFLSHKIKNKGSKKMNWVEVVPRGRRGTSSSDTSGGQVRTNARVLFYDTGVMASPFMLCRHVWCWRRRCFPLCVSLCGVKGIKQTMLLRRLTLCTRSPLDLQRRVFCRLLTRPLTQGKPCSHTSDPV